MLLESVSNHNTPGDDEFINAMQNVPQLLKMATPSTIYDNSQYITRLLSPVNKDPTDPNVYRPISLLRSDVKILARSWQTD